MSKNWETISMEELVAAFPRPCVYPPHHEEICDAVERRRAELSLQDLVKLIPLSRYLTEKVLRQELELRDLTSSGVSIEELTVLLLIKSSNEEQAVLAKAMARRADCSWEYLWLIALLVSKWGQASKEIAKAMLPKLEPLSSVMLCTLLKAMKDQGFQSDQGLDAVVLQILGQREEVSDDELLQLLDETKESMGAHWALVKALKDRCTTKSTRKLLDFLRRPLRWDLIRRVAEICLSRGDCTLQEILTAVVSERHKMLIAKHLGSR